MVWKKYKFYNFTITFQLVEQFLAEEVQVGGRENEKLQSQLYIGV